MEQESIRVETLHPLLMDCLSCTDIMTLIVNCPPYPFLFLVFVNRQRKCLYPITMGIMQRHVLLPIQIIILPIILGLHLPERIEMDPK